MTPTLLTLAMTLAADPPGPPIDTSFLRQYAETRGFLLGRPVKPKITPDGKAVLFLRSGPTSPKQSLFEFSVETKETKEILSPDTLLKGADENLSPEEKARRERQRVSAGGFADYFLDEAGQRVLVSLSGKLFILDRRDGKTTELKTGPGPCIDPKWSPDGKFVAYVRGFDVFAFDLAAGKELAVTTGGTSVVTHGLAEFVAQEEMHRHTGYWWSPDSKFIAYEEADHTGVEVWYPSDPAKPDGTPVPQYYPRPGKKNVAVKLGIVPVTGGKTVWVEWDREKYEYLAAVKWVQPSNGLFLILQSRSQQHQSVSQLLIINTLKDWITDTDAAWLPIIQVEFGSGHVLHFLSEFGGRKEIRARELRGNELVLVPYSELPVDIIKSFPLYGSQRDPGGVMRAFHAVAYHSAPDPTQSHVRIKEYETPGIEIITPGADRVRHVTEQPGYHTGVFSDRSTPFVVSSTTLSQHPRSTVYSQDLDKLGTLPSVALEPAFKPNVVVEKVGDYYTAVVRPRQFDKTKKYPVIVDVYGGPGHLHVIQAMKNWLIPQWLADQGFIVVAIDNRGTPGRGREWERSIYQKFGTVPLEDQVKGLQALGAKHPELDLTRVGIVGWSFGGYMAANAVLRRPDVFHAAVAGAPVTDWEDYDTHYTERYLGLLPESRKAYDEASLIPLAKNLSRPLLLVHGTADDNVFYRHTLKLTDALFRAGKQFDVLPLSGITHMYSADPQVAERLWERNVKFFRQHLGGPK